MNSQFLPFYDRSRTGESLAYPVKLAISLGTGMLYLMIQYLSVANKLVIVQQHCWILAVIISAALLALYFATDLFYRNLPLVQKIQGRFPVSEEVGQNWLTDRGYLLWGSALAFITVLVGILLGVPEAFHQNRLALAAIYTGYALAGFASGMGLYGIRGVIILYLKLAPCLHNSLDHMAEDGAGGIKRLGDSLWFFAMITGAVGLLTSVYMFEVSWRNLDYGWVRMLFLVWLAFPYLVAISIVLIPGLAIRRSVQHFKQNKELELRGQQARIYAALKQVNAEGDDGDIVARNRELTVQLSDIQQQIINLRAMRTSHIDSKK